MSLRTLYDEASLWMTPSGYEDGKLFSELPTDGSGDFTFSRGSNLAATRVDVNGLIEKGRENRFYPSDFSSGLSQTRCSITPNAADPYGGTEAVQFITSLDASTTHYILKNVVIAAIGQVMTMSVTAKANGYDFFRIEQGNNSKGATFNLLDGTIDNDNGIAASIESVGNGWYKCSVAVLTISTGFAWVAFFMPTSSVSYTGDGVSGGFLYGAQLEVGLVATDYIETGASTAQAGILEDMPRLDYSGGVSCPALLLEPQRTNLFDNSEYIEGWSTSNTGASIEENAATSPEGVVNAAKIKEDATNAAHAVRQLTGPTLTSGTDYTFSFFAKKGERSIVALSNTIGASNDANCFFDLENGQVLTNQFNSASIEDFGNGWYRCIATDTADAADDYDTRIYTATADNQFSHQGVSGNGLYIYGLQLEQGSYKTSYIPTHGSSVTRNFDNATTTSEEDVLTSGEGIVFMEFEINDTTITGYPEVIRIENPSDTTDKFWFYIFDDSDAGEIRFGYRLDDTAVKKVEGSVTLDATTTAKVAMRLENNNYALYYNGTKQTPTQYAGVVSNLRKITTRGREHFNGLRVKQFAIFNEALSDSELATLTTL